MLLHFYNVNKDEHNFLYLCNKQTNAHYFREKVVCAQLEDLKSDMAELHQIPNTAVRQTVKEVILTKINILSAKIASLNELVGG
jgi:gluconate kinase